MWGSVANPCNDDDVGSQEEQVGPAECRRIALNEEHHANRQHSESRRDESDTHQRPTKSLAASNRSRLANEHETGQSGTDKHAEGTSCVGGILAPNDRHDGTNGKEPEHDECIRGELHA